MPEIPSQTPEEQVSAAPAAAPPVAGPGDDAVERALSVPTRAGIFRRLRTEGRPVSAREAAELFGLHPNVARNHLDVLADAGLVVTGRRKHPGGGRPAKVYVAREQADRGQAAPVPPGSQLATAVVVQLIAGLSEHEPKLELLAEQQGRRLVTASAGKADIREFDAAAVVAVEALRAAFPEVRIIAVGDDEVEVAGLEVSLRIVGEIDARVGDALARGFLRGALAAAGAPALVESRGGRVRAKLDEAAIGAVPSATATADVRRRDGQGAVFASMRAMAGLRPGDHLEILIGSDATPAVFARWADRAGHQLVDVTRVRDARGRDAIRLLIRKAAG